MVPTVPALAAPLARSRRVPLLLWYTHWHASRSLAHRDAARGRRPQRRRGRASRSTARRSAAIGHAIDVDVFDAPPPSRTQARSGCLRFGRTARWKGLATLLDAFSLVDARCDVRVARPVADPRRGRRTVASSSCGSAGDPRVNVEQPVPRARRARAAALAPTSSSAPPNRAQARRSTRRSTRLRPARGRWSPRTPRWPRS